MPKQSDFPTKSLFLHLFALLPPPKKKKDFALATPTSRDSDWACRDHPSRIFGVFFCVNNFYSPYTRPHLFAPFPIPFLVFCLRLGQDGLAYIIREFDCPLSYEATYPSLRKCKCVCVCVRLCVCFSVFSVFCSEVKNGVLLFGDIIRV